MTEDDIVRECGCVERHDPDFEAWFLLTQCARHSAVSAEAEQQITRNTSLELDYFVAQSCEGRRAERIRPKDTTRARP